MARKQPVQFTMTAATPSHDHAMNPSTATMTTSSATASSASATSDTTSVAVPPFSPLLSLRYSLLSSLFGVLGSSAAKVGLSDAWTHHMTHLVIETIGGETAVKTVNLAEQINEQIEKPLFYVIRFSFILFQLLLNGLMLSYFVHSMAASNSLLASVYNQAASSMIAVSISIKNQSNTGA